MGAAGTTLGMRLQRRSPAAGLHLLTGASLGEALGAWLQHVMHHGGGKYSTGHAARA